MTTTPVDPVCDAAFSLDVIEHIPPELESKYIENIAKSLTSNGVCILGTPDIASQQYASECSKLGHINLKSAETLKQSLLTYFENVFNFSMNDEMVHTGFSPMANYIFVMGVGVK